MPRFSVVKNDVIGDMLNEVMGRLAEFCESEYRRLTGNMDSESKVVPINDPIFDVASTDGEPCPVTYSKGIVR
ncbi:hypothetical protein ABWC92_004585 [Escherichia coli]